MSAPDFHAQRELYLAGGLQGEQRTAFEAHARDCAECTRDISSWRSFGSVLKKQLQPLRRAPTSTEVAHLIALAEEPRSMTVRWVVPAFAMAAVLVVAVVVGVVLKRGPAETPWVATVVASSGFTASGPADFATGAGGHALVRLGEDDVGLGAATALTVSHASSTSTVLRLGHGVVAAHVNPARGKRNFDIETPMGRVHVVGTIFRVSASDESLEVDVVRGVVEVERKGVKTRVPAGQALRVTRDAEGALAPFEAEAFSELSAQPPAVVVAPAVPEVTEADAGVVAVAVPAKRGAPVAAWRSAAARGECASVIAAAERYVKGDAGDADAWLILGDCRRRQREFAPAVTAYLAAAKTREPQGKQGLLQAAELLQQELKQPQQAVVVIDSYLRTKPERRLEAAALVRKARALVELGKKAEAKAVLSDAVKRLPETPSAAEANRLLENL